MPYTETTHIGANRPKGSRTAVDINRKYGSSASICQLALANAAIKAEDPVAVGLPAPEEGKPFWGLRTGKWHAATEIAENASSSNFSRPWDATSTWEKLMAEPSKRLEVADLSEMVRIGKYMPERQSVIRGLFSEAARAYAYSLQEGDGELKKFETMPYYASVVGEHVHDPDRLAAWASLLGQTTKEARATVLSAIKPMAGLTGGGLANKEYKNLWPTTTYVRYVWLQNPLEADSKGVVYWGNSGRFHPVNCTRLVMDTPFAPLADTVELDAHTITATQTVQGSSVSREIKFTCMASTGAKACACSGKKMFPARYATKTAGSIASGNRFLTGTTDPRMVLGCTSEEQEKIEGRRTLTKAVMAGLKTSTMIPGQMTNIIAGAINDCDDRAVRQEKSSKANEILERIDKAYKPEEGSKKRNILSVAQFEEIAKDRKSVV